MRTALAWLAVCLTAPAHAHDFWIKPSSFRVEPGHPVELDLRVGDDYPGESLPRASTMIEKFAAFGPGGEVSVVGREGRSPAGTFHPAAPGLYAVAYDSNPTRVELDGATFESYLAEKGLEKVSEARAARGQSRDSATEAFSRCAKTIVAAGSDVSSGFDRPTGMRLELFPETNPFVMTPGDAMRARLEFEGKPLANALVIATSLADPEARVSGRTNQTGRVQLALPVAGVWIVNAVHMVPAPAGTAAQWESMWASLSFEIGAADPQTGQSDRRSRP